MAEVFRVRAVAGRYNGRELALKRLLPALRKDEEAVRRPASEFLRRQGYHVIEAKDGVEALEVGRQYTFDIHLLVTDVVMPNLSGGELAEQILHERSEMRLLFVSGYAGKTVLDHKVVDLETNFLQKPYTLRQLAQKVRGALDQMTLCSETVEGGGSRSQLKA